MLIPSTPLPLSPSQTALLGRLAEDLSCTPDEIVGQMLEKYAVEHQQQMGVKAALTQVAAGQSYSAEEVFAEFMSDEA
jgi:predicted transcriptional regulator